jgi:hypothetical protein
MTNSSLVVGTRRYSRPWWLIGVVLSCATAIVTEASIGEPLSLLLLGAALVTAASRLRHSYGKNFRTGSSHRISTPPVSGN